MPNPLLLDFVLFLQTNQLVAGDGIDAFRDFIPEEPATLVVLQEYGGAPLTVYDPTAHRSIQVVTRDKDADAARAKALQIFKVFQNKLGEDNRLDLTEERWGQVYLRQPPFKYKTDENNRTYYCFNVGITTTID